MQTGIPGMTGTLKSPHCQIDKAEGILCLYIKMFGWHCNPTYLPEQI
jgi:hypothetical protein